MMRKRTQGRAQLRYALTLPLIAGLGFLFAQFRIEAQTPTTANSTLPPPPPAMVPSKVGKEETNAQLYSSIPKEVVVKSDTTPAKAKEVVVPGFPLVKEQRQELERVVTGYPMPDLSKEVVVVGYSASNPVPDPVFKVVEKMPEYPEGMTSMLKFLAQNIRYPEAAKKENIEGMVVVQFIIAKDGSITDPHVVKGIGGGANEEALRVVKMMPKWTPGMQKGQAVNVQFNLPIRFQLEGNNKAQEVEKVKLQEGREVFRVVERMPAYEDGQQGLVDFLAKNLKYPTVAKENGIEGVVVVEFIVETDGRVSGTKLMKGIGAGCDEEAVRVVNLTRWTPGMQNNKVVPVKYTLPISFKLDTKKANVTPLLSSSALKVDDFKASPNPSKGLFNVSFRAEQKDTNIEVYNMAGQRVYTQALSNFDGYYNGQIDLSKQPKGEYLVRVTQGGAQYSQKLLKQ